MVGNNAYTGAAALSMCENDARDMSELLREGGYVVTQLLNATKRQYVLGIVVVSSSPGAPHLPTEFFPTVGVVLLKPGGERAS